MLNVRGKGVAGKRGVKGSGTAGTSLHSWPGHRQVCVVPAAL